MLDRLLRAYFGYVFFNHVGLRTLGVGGIHTVKSLSSVSFANFWELRFQFTLK